MAEEGEEKLVDAALIGDVASPMTEESGLVFIVEDRVALEVAAFGRLEFPPDVAETVARALLRGAKMLREEKPKHGTIILAG